MNDYSCLKDGEIYFQPQYLSSDLGDYLKGFSPNLTVHTVSSESPDTQLWSLTAAVEAADGRESGTAEIALGIPRSFTRWFSLGRIVFCWLAPRHGRGKFAPPEDAILCSFLRWDGTHVVALAVSGINDVLTFFRGDAEGNVVVSCKNDQEQQGQAKVIVAAGRNFESANAAVMYHARKLVRGDEYITDDMKAAMQTANQSVDAYSMEQWYDGLNYCTWNGIGQDLTEDNILSALEVLKENNIKITNLIIDDNWQSLDDRGWALQHRWTDFEANKNGFPKGLKHTIESIRRQNSNIQHISVWHAILGYWGGIAPGSALAQKYKTREVRLQNTGGVPIDGALVVDAEDVPRMYDDFYKFLTETGVDSVKTDAQSFLDLFKDADDRRDLVTAYQDAWTVASLRYFSTRAISCMSQAPQILFHSQLLTNKPRLMVRNSDGELILS